MLYTPNMHVSIVGPGVDTSVFGGDKIMEGCVEEGTLLLSLSEQVSAG